ncbi:hypothetical protein BXU06_12725 [Aquaspirillum sp. LM1]|uniref:MerR family transcriptional regulator n=1 Tax=Aquaspirillum sp. LM1 TaxID=1938604 RepID=UPI0009839CB6|nr:MerR family transcriptional regulator [Aquaspirillum sp. LM1]AQR65821.1 hypothetical protein BXU06_12725 [Aquaspirillum sp. LM1]
MTQAGQPQPASGLPISVVERETGIPKDLLRMWERRYGFPQPGRDAQGDRVYPRDQVDKLRTVRRLMDQGFRPGKIIHLSPEALAELSEARRPRANPPAVCARLESLLKSQDGHAIRDELQSQLHGQGLRHFVCDFLPAANQLVGELWMRGVVEIHEEHLYTEQVTRILRETLSVLSAPPAQPRVMLTTCPGEQHVLGLLMAEALLRLAACDVLAFGAEMPLTDIAQAARKHQVDILALSFSQSYDGNPLDTLDSLRSLLPDRVTLWVGGAGCQTVKTSAGRWQVLRSLNELEPLLHHWRQCHPG